MPQVTKIGSDSYKVREFSQSMPHLSATVTFIGGKAKVIDRTGYLQDSIWDDRAIQQVQFALVTDTVRVSDNKDG